MTRPAPKVVRHLQLEIQQPENAQLAAAAHTSVPAVQNLAAQMTYHQNNESAALLQQLSSHRAQPIT